MAWSFVTFATINMAHIRYLRFHRFQRQCHPRDHQHGPYQILAVPQIPEAVPSEGGILIHHAACLLREGDAFLISIGAQIAVVVLQGHQPMAFILNEFQQAGVLRIIGHARGAEHQFAPEFAAPHAAGGHAFVVVAPFDRGAGLAENVFFREIRKDAELEETVHFLARNAFQADILQLAVTIFVHSNLMINCSTPSPRFTANH